jgi:hypothetical protein
MPIYEYTSEAFLPVEPTTFSNEGIYERRDLQRLIRQDIKLLSPELKVLAQEFGNWEDSSRRVDLLCVDRSANIVVVELKRTEDGGNMELQALRYAAMVSAMTFDMAVNAYADDVSSEGVSRERARTDLLNFLGWETAEDGPFANAVRVILVSADFSKEMTTAVLWLNDQGLDIRCFRLRPYKLADTRVLVHLEQILPLQEASDYQTQLRVKAKDQATSSDSQTRHLFRTAFWTSLLVRAREKTTLHQTCRALTSSYLSAGIGRSGLSLTYRVAGKTASVELYIDFVRDGKEKNLQIFNAFRLHQSEIEQTFGGALEWQDSPDARACQIKKTFEAGYLLAETEWPALQASMIDSMIRLDQAIRPHAMLLTT